MRWFFLFLMLANATLLFWYATTRPRSEPVETARVSELGVKLVSEMPAEQLLPRVDPIRVGVEALAPAPTVSCFVIGDTDDLMTAQRIMNFFNQRGQQVFIKQQAAPRVIGYQLVLPAPDGDAARLDLLDRLDRLGVVPESQMGDGRLRFVIGIFENRFKAERELGRIKAAQLNVGLSPVEVDDWSYFVQINGPFGQEMSNKINAIVQKAYPMIKIEKKLCKGVATP